MGEEEGDSRREEWDKAASRKHHLLQRALGPGFAASLASATSMSNSWLGAGH